MGKKTGLKIKIKKKRENHTHTHTHTHTHKEETAKESQKPNVEAEVYDNNKKM